MLGFVAAHFRGVAEESIMALVDFQASMPFLIIALAGCYYGFQTTGGAEGVGESTKKAVVASCVMILVMDYFLAEVIFRLLFG